MPQEKSFLRHIRICTDHEAGAFRSLEIAGKALGAVTKETASFLLKKTTDFVETQNGIALSDSCDDFYARTMALARAAEKLCSHYDQRLRNEMYPVFENWGDEPLAKLDRAAVPILGVHAYGVHANGFVKKDDGLYIWIGERAKDRPQDPGKLDHIVAGGMPIGVTPRDNLIKEAWEEAGMDERLAKTARAVGSLTYKSDRQHGMRHDTLFIYDIELPDSFIPHNKDGEVAGFYLMPAKEVAAIIHDSDRFKYNCNLVLIDFLIRQGVLTATHPGFADIEAGLAPLKGPSGE